MRYRRKTNYASWTSSLPAKRLAVALDASTAKENGARSAFPSGLAHRLNICTYTCTAFSMATFPTSDRICDTKEKAPQTATAIPPPRTRPRVSCSTSSTVVAMIAARSGRELKS